MEIDREDEPRYQGRHFLVVPAPVAPPGLVRPVRACDDPEREEGESERDGLVDQFLELWQTGNKNKGAPMVKMQTLLQQKHFDAAGRIHDRVRAALVINAWNEFVAGRKGNNKVLDWTLAMDFPIIAGNGK